MNFSDILQTVLNWLTTEGLKILIGIVLLFFVFKLINFVSRRVDKKLNKKNVDMTIKSVAIATVRKILKILTFVCFLGYVGVETSSIAAAIASIGLAIGLALQGSLSNFAGGVIILMMAPFKLGHFIECGSFSGTVEEIDLFYTFIATVDNKVVMLPNAMVANNTIINYSKKDTRRVDMTFSISYNDDFEKAKELILDCAMNTKLVLNDPAPFVNIVSHNLSSIDIVVKVWCKAGDYWTIHYQMLEKVKKAFDKNKITIPFPQVDVHMQPSEQKKK